MNVPIFLPMDTWFRLGDWLTGDGAEIADALGIKPNVFTGSITEDELIFGLGDGLNVWPEKLRPAYLAATVAN